MPKKSIDIITIQELSELRLNDAYEGLVKGVKIDKKKNILKVVVLNLSNSQYGRLHTILLPLPACPGNPVCLFLEACGIDTCEIGQQIDLNSLIGKKLGIIFMDHQPPYDHRSVQFVKLKERSSHGNRTE